MPVSKSVRKSNIAKWNAPTTFRHTKMFIKGPERLPIEIHSWLEKE